jgi:hypothetical protein
MALPSSGEISLGMVNYEVANKVGTGTTIDKDDVATTADADMSDLTYLFSNDADDIGSGVSRANLLAAPYGMNEFYQYTFASCILVGTEILMADGSNRLVEDLLIDDEVCSVVIPDHPKKKYNDFSIESLDGFKKDVGLVKQLTFDFKVRYMNINEKYHVTEKHPTFVWKDKIKRFEWWQTKDIEIGDKMVTSDFEVEEVTTIEKMHKDVEIVQLGLRDIHTYFANGYLCHQ